MNGAAYLLLHQIERSGGSSKLVPASYLERRRIILTDTDAVGGVTKLGDRPQHASDEDHQYNADHQRDDDEKSEQLTGSVPVSCGNLLPLLSALLHSSMQQIARIAVDIGRLRFHREILPHFLLIAVHRKQFILRLSVIDHCIADCLLEDKLCLTVYTKIRYQFTQTLISSGARFDIVFERVFRQTRTNIGFKRHVFCRKRIHESCNIHIFVHDNVGLCAETAQLLCGEDNQRPQRHQHDPHQ